MFSVLLRSFEASANLLLHRVSFLLVFGVFERETKGNALVV